MGAECERMTKAPPKPALTTYILETTKGVRKVTVPSAWKVTFGPLIAGKTGGPGTLALRFYENNKENQRAIFTDVNSFRDEAIPIMEKVTRTKQQVMRKDGPAGSRDVIVEARMTEWVDPNKPEDIQPEAEFLRIAAHEDKVEF